MAGTFTQILIVAAILRVTLWADEQPTVQVTTELLRQHEEQRSQEMAWLREMEQRSQEPSGVIQGSLLLSACQHWWFWAAAEMLLVLFAFYWLPRHGNCGYESSADAEPPAEPRRKRKRRRRRMHGTADCSDTLDQIKSPDVCLEWKDMQDLEEEGVKGLIDASAKPFPEETFG